MDLTLPLDSQGCAGRFLSGHLQRHMICAKLLKPVVDGAESQFRFVALAAEMAQKKMSQVGRDDLFGCLGSGFIGEVAVPAHDSLLQAPWPTQTILQHSHVVIGFQHEDICAAHAFDDQPGDVAEVSEKTDVARSRPQQKPNRILCIVRHGESFHDNIADIKGAARRE